MSCSHGSEGPNHSPSICHTKDGRWFITHGMGARDLKNLVPLLSKYDAQADLQPPAPEVDVRARQVPGTAGARGAPPHALFFGRGGFRVLAPQGKPLVPARKSRLVLARPSEAPPRPLRR